MALHNDFCRVHKTLRVTPAREAGIADHVWGIEGIVSLLWKRGVEMDRVFDTLERIRMLWKRLGELQAGTSEHEALMKQIRALSAEYQALIDAPKKPPTLK